jgi:hypothetical protein
MSMVLVTTETTIGDITQTTMMDRIPMSPMMMDTTMTMDHLHRRMQ